MAAKETFGKTVDQDVCVVGYGDCRPRLCKNASFSKIAKIFTT
jgi:hypothetical protein